MMKRTWVPVAPGLCLTACWLGAIPVQAVQYTITDLGTLGGTRSEAYGLSVNGQVVGWSYPTGSTTERAFLYSDGAMQDLGTLGGMRSEAYGVNAGGEVVGYSNPTGGYPDHAFLYSGGAIQDLGTLGGPHSWAQGINDSGQVVGCAYSTVRQTAFLYSQGIMHDLGTLGGSYSYGLAVNASSQVTGYSATTTGETRAFLYNEGIMQDLGTLGGDASVGQGINASGQVVGYSYLAGSTDDYHAFLYSGGIMQDLGTLGGSQSKACGVNADGRVVGWARRASGGMRAFIYSDGTMVDLNTLLPADSDWTLTQATAINDAGQIVGSGNNPAGKIHAFLLTPVFCDIQIKRAYILNYMDEETPPRLGDPWVLVAAEYRVIGAPSAPITIRLRCGGEQATPTQNVGPGESWSVSWAFSTNIDGEVPWSVEFDPDHLLGDADYSNNTTSGSYTPLAPDHVIERYMVRPISATEGRYAEFSPNSGTVGRIEYLFGEPVVSSSQANIREYIPPAGAQRIITAPSGIPVHRVQWFNFDTSVQTVATATHSFKADLWNVRVNRDVLETVTWEDLDKPLPSDVATWRQSEQICPTDHPKINEFVAEYLPAGYRGTMSPYTAARRLFQGVANKLDYGPKVGPINALMNEPHRGDCGDFSRVFVAAMRNIGFAARVSSGWWEGDDPPDILWHMWTEFYMPGYGWVPADPTKSNDSDTTGTFAYNFGNMAFLWQLCSVTFGGPCTWPELGINIDDLQVPWWYWNGGAAFVSTACPASLHLEPPAALLLEKPWVKGGDHLFAVVDVRDRAPAGGMTVTLSSTSPAVSVPPSVTLPQDWRSVQVSITTTSVATDQDVIIQATLPDRTVSASLLVKAASPALVSVTVAPSVVGGTEVNGTVTLDAPAPAEGITVYLSTSPPDVVSVAAAILVPAGSSNVGFTLRGNQVPSSTPVTLSAECCQSTQTASLTVTPSLWTISGTVTDSRALQVAGVAMTGLPGSPATGPDGTYSATVNYGWSGVVEPSKPGLRFNPPTRTYVSVSVNLTGQDYTAGIAADLDGDRDVDPQDVSLFLACFSGPSTPPKSGCESADLDGDDDVDQSDFGILQRCHSGAGFDADPSCSQ
jgi:probable HAF family extracellular repeat protein